MKRIEKRSEQQKARDRERSKIRWAENKHDPEFRKKSVEATRKWQLENVAKYMCGRSKQAAKRLGIPFDLKPEDIVIPEVCPVFGVPMIVGGRHTPSVDRIIPSLGYVKGNIQIISMRANAMKTDATPGELLKFSKWILANYYPI